MTPRRLAAWFIFITLSIVVVFTPQRKPSGGEGLLACAASESAPVYLPLAMQNYPLPSSMGVEMFSITSGRGGLQWVLETNTRWVRRNGLLWSKVEAVEGQYDWDAVKTLEQELINASNNNLQVILIVRSTPPWAQYLPSNEAGLEDVPCARIREEKLEAFANFLHAAVERYSNPPYNVKYWQIWNEPDADYDLLVEQMRQPESFFGCWGDPNEEDFGGGYYSKVLQAVYPRMKEANPNIQVVLGGLLLSCDTNLPGCQNNNARYFEGILKNGGGEFFDIVALNGYDYYYDLLGKFGNANWGSRYTGDLAPVKKARFIRSVLDSYGLAKPIWATEIGLSCGYDEKENEDKCLSSEYEQTKAYYVAQAFAATLAEGIAVSNWYSLNASWGGTQLANKDGTTRPAYDAYKVVKAKLDGATFVRHLREVHEGLNGFEFTNHRRRIWLVWTAREENYTPLPVTIQLPSPPLSISDVFGNPVEITGNELTVTVAPLYIEW